MDPRTIQPVFVGNPTLEVYWEACLQFRRGYLAWRDGSYEGDAQELKSRAELILAMGMASAIGGSKQLGADYRRIFKAYDETFKHCEMLGHLSGVPEELWPSRQKQRKRA
ncbi:MAG: hypothetical protein AABY16_04600 [Nanoarchaeota archaeon]